MLYPRQDWFNTIPFKVLLEITIPSAVFMDSMGTKFATTIHDQLSHRTEPPISFNQLIHYKLTVLGIDILELTASKDHSGCIV